MSLPMALQDRPTKRFESDHYVEGYATTFETPYLLFEYDGIQFFEVIDRGALEEADVSDVIFQYDHSGRVLARLSNHTLGIEADEKGLLTYANLSQSASARNLYEEIENGLVTRMSWAFSVREESYDKESRTRRIRKIKKVYDVSAVSFPANPDTEISARSFAQGRLELEQREAQNARNIALLKLKLQLH